jgi:hypothetical protein
MTSFVKVALVFDDRFKRTVANGSTDCAVCMFLKEESQELDEIRRYKSMQGCENATRNGLL